MLPCVWERNVTPSVIPKVHAHAFATVHSQRFTPPSECDAKPEIAKPRHATRTPSRREEIVNPPQMLQDSAKSMRCLHFMLRRAPHHPEGKSRKLTDRIKVCSSRQQPEPAMPETATPSREKSRMTGEQIKSQTGCPSVNDGSLSENRVR